MKAKWMSAMEVLLTLYPKALIAKKLGVSVPSVYYWSKGGSPAPEAQEKIIALAKEELQDELNQ